MTAASFTIVRPPVDVLDKFSKPVECLALGYLGAALRLDGHHVALLDGMLHDWSDEATVRHIVETEPAAVGFTVVLNHFPKRLRSILTLLRSAGFTQPVLVGGHAVSFFPEWILEHVPEVDAVVCGEGEDPLRGIAAAIAAGQDWRGVAGVNARDTDGKAVRTAVGPRNTLKHPLRPARDLTESIIESNGLVAISTSRGCYARCSFCSVPRFYGLDRNRLLANGDWYAASVTDTVDEITSLAERYELRELLIVDDEFFGADAHSKDRAVAIGRELAQRGLAVHFALSCRAENVDERTLSGLQTGGLRHVFMGIESGSPADLRLYAKGHTVEQNRRAVLTVKKLGLSFQCGFMFFNHRSTLDTIEENLDFLDSVGEAKPIIVDSWVDPHYGTPMQVLMRREGALLGDGFEMKMRILNPQAAVVKEVASRVATAFLPVMNVIAALGSAVTYEWRRRVPGRTTHQQELIDAFEAMANRAYVDVVRSTVVNLRESAGATDESVFHEAERRLADAQDRVTIGQAILLHQLQAEGGVRYWSQADLITQEHGAAGAPTAR